MALLLAIPDDNMIPVISRALAPIFVPMGIVRHPTKPLSIVVTVVTSSLCTYLQGITPTTFAQVLAEIVSLTVPGTLKTAVKETSL